MPIWKLLLLAIKLDELKPGNGAFPLVELAHARTVGDLVELVDVWSQRDTVPSAIDDTAPRRAVG